MSVTDPIADMLSSVKNASQVGKEEVVVPYSRFKEQLASLLKREGFVSGVRKFKEKESSRYYIALKLTYDTEGRPKITHIRRISKPGQRVYASADVLKSPPVGIKVISTSQGLLTGRDARRKRLGGEEMAEIW
jgi:small subunit ribosomal protein S8